ncbi:hypothetical protein [Xenorhabdus bovienii]|uniref:hypothetical protein n=1 Tax=Xenorhabdus bovienii TaxID=40576 RepID=UPI0023B31F7C|nr:hypothetical protein [Xenorhabdus bovienii]MDE9447142.1 hypothetical protein [Xenorhabdus bovienii]MDE9589590.1 hypothetical protein [Xenorhabdus bovienii]
MSEKSSIFNYDRYNTSVADSSVIESISKTLEKVLIKVMNVLSEGHQHSNHLTDNSEG